MGAGACWPRAGHTARWRIRRDARGPHARPAARTEQAASRGAIAGQTCVGWRSSCMMSGQLDASSTSNLHAAAGGGRRRQAAPPGTVPRPRRRTHAMARRVDRPAVRGRVACALSGGDAGQQDACRNVDGRRAATRDTHLAAARAAQSRMDAAAASLSIAWCSEAVQRSAWESWSGGFGGVAAGAVCLLAFAGGGCGEEKL